MQYLIPFLFSFVLTVLLIKGALKLFPRIGFMDRPFKYGLKREPIPYYGGTIIVAVFLLAVLIFVPLDAHLIGLLLGAILIASVSFMDDMFGLSPFLRLGIQILAALILIFSGIGIQSLSNPFGAPFILGQPKFVLEFDGQLLVSISILSAIFVVMWVVAAVNTLNWQDGLNGLSSGISAISSLAIFLLSIRPGIHFDYSSQVPVAMISIILFGCVLAFWFFDFYPAKILMGDTGSMFLGFILATLAIFSGGKIATAFLVLGFPFLDAVWVILRRIIQGKSPLKGDMKHLHHRLLEIGLSQRQAMCLIYFICSTFGLMAVFLNNIQKVYAFGFLFLIMVIVGGTSVYLARKKM